MSKIRGSNQRHIESTTEQPDVTTNGTSVQGPASNAPDASVAPDRQHLTGIGYLLLAAFFLLLAFGLLVLVWNILRRRRNHQRTTDGSEDPTTDIENTSASKRRIHRRYETIEHWIITKRVLPHTERCKMIEEMLLTNNSQQTGIQDHSSETKMSHSVTCDDRHMTNATPECPICMSEMKLGQIVSWSSNPQCIHGAYLLSAQRG
jgi:hypothetical protein